MAIPLSELLRDLPLPEAGGDVRIAGLTADSRDVQPGWLFAALPGTVTDGTRFVADAAEAGAAAVLTGSDASVGAEVPVVHAAEPRRAFAQAAARFYKRQPEVTVAVTGTNGKTSVASFLRQIWEAMGLAAASMGTTGITSPAGTSPLQHTTPDPVALHRMLAELQAQRVTHLALEASSHGLAQHRLDGVRLAAGAFTNISRDHLDYHPDFEDYFGAKMRLFDDLLQPGAAAVVNADTPHAAEVAARCRARGLRVVSVGANGDAARLDRQEVRGFGQDLRIVTARRSYEVYLPLVGAFQAANALVAAGLAIACGGPEEVAMRAIETLKGAKGRLEHVATTPAGAPVFVDYAHTPDALENALVALRPYAAARLVLVFGCGGDRDAGKRPQMGAVAAQHADAVFVTDDNPRSEDPARIRAAIRRACPEAREIGDRATAIRTAVGELCEGDLLLVAGKGHETGQIVGTQTLPFSDHAVVRAALDQRMAG